MVVVLSCRQDGCWDAAAVSSRQNEGWGEGGRDAAASAAVFTPALLLSLFLLLLLLLLSHDFRDGYGAIFIGVARLSMYKASSIGSLWQVATLVIETNAYPRFKDMSSSSQHWHSLELLFFSSTATTSGHSLAEGVFRTGRYFFLGS